MFQHYLLLHLLFSNFLVFPQTTYLTEFSLLGPYHNATYPYNVTVGKNYRLYLDVENRLGSCAYYLIQVKFRNQTQSAPDSFNHTNSNQPSLGNITFFVADKETLELPIDISFQYKLGENNTELDMQNIILNGTVLNANTQPLLGIPKEKGSMETCSLNYGFSTIHLTLSSTINAMLAYG